jgi:hypothetical protein
MNIQYVTNTEGDRIAVQIPLEQWEIIKAELGLYNGDDETAEIMADVDLVQSIKTGREQARRGVGRRLEDVNV